MLVLFVLPLRSWVLYVFHENTDLQRLWQEEPYAGVPAKIRWAILHVIWSMFMQPVEQCPAPARVCLPRSGGLQDHSWFRVGSTAMHSQSAMNA